MITSTDIDIDFADRNKALTLFSHIPAMMKKDGKEMKHNTGVYFHDIPVNPITDLPSFDYEEAEELGYFKVDFINNSVYSELSGRDHLERLLEVEPMWELLESEEFVSLLTHIGNHFDIVNTIKPKSIPELAIVLAIIRPGKRYLLNENMQKIKDEVWVEPTDGSYFFKKSHATAFAMLITLQMNVLVDKYS